MSRPGPPCALNLLLFYGVFHNLFARKSSFSLRPMLNSKLRAFWQADRDLVVKYQGPLVGHFMSNHPKILNLDTHTSRIFMKVTETVEISNTNKP